MPIALAERLPILIVEDASFQAGMLPRGRRRQLGGLAPASDSDGHADHGSLLLVRADSAVQAALSQCSAPLRPYVHICIHNGAANFKRRAIFLEISSHEGSSDAVGINSENSAP